MPSTRRPLLVSQKAEPPPEDAPSNQRSIHNKSITSRIPTSLTSPRISNLRFPAPYLCLTFSPKHAGHIHSKEGLPGAFGRIDGGPVPLRSVGTARRQGQSCIQQPKSAPASAAAHSPGIRPRHRQAGLPVGQAADAAHLQDRADCSGLRHNRCVFCLFSFLFGFVKCLLMTRRIMHVWCRTAS